MALDDGWAINIGGGSTVIVSMIVLAMEDCMCMMMF